MSTSKRSNRFLGWTLALVATVAAALVVSSVSVAEETKAPAGKIVCDGSTTVGPIAKAFADYFMKQTGVNVTVGESGSGNGAKSLINGTCDIGNMSRFMKETEFKAAVEKGVMPVATVIAMDGVCLIVHPSNPIKALTTDQVKGIYTGKIKKWSEIGGPDADIVIISRDTNSGTYETFAEKVLKEEKIASGVEYVTSNGAIRARVQNTPAAVGYVGLAFTTDGVKALEINGVMPTKRTIATGKYPVARPLFMFTNGYPKLGSPLHEFVTLYLTKKGQDIIDSVGFVPVTNYE